MSIVLPLMMPWPKTTVRTAVTLVVSSGVIFLSVAGIAIGVTGVSFVVSSVSRSLVVCQSAGLVWGA